MEEVNKEYKCNSCGSTSVDTPGMCCGGERKEVCKTCGEARKEDGTCGCAKE